MVSRWNHRCSWMFSETTLETILYEVGHEVIATKSVCLSSEGRSFVMRSLNPCPENFSLNVVDYPNLLGGGGGIIYYAKSEVLELESNLLFLRGEVIYYAKSEALELE